MGNIDLIHSAFLLINARFDDTNPGKEEGKYFVEIEKTIKWLGLIYILIDHQ